MDASFLGLRRGAALRSFAVGALWLSFGCSDEPAATSKSCDAECQDAIAARALRETLKVVYNLTLQGNPVGEQDESTDCPLGGSARVSGTATSVAEQGATEIDLVYELSACAYLQRDDEPEESYGTIIEGLIGARGIMAVQPTATTALVFEAEALSIGGKLFDPPLDYVELSCDLRLAQNGNLLSGIWCGRELGLGVDL